MKSWRAWIPWVLFGAFLGVVFILNVCYSFSSDDCVYALAWQVPEGAIRPRLGSWAMVWAENVADGYRPVVHLFARLFAGWWGKGAFNLVNTAMMGFLLLLLNRLATGSWQMTQRVVLLITLVFLVLCKGESYLWCAGSVNYLWGGTATLAFCLMREQLDQATPRRWALPLMGVAALLCGWAQEGFALPICFALGLWSLTHLRELTPSKVVLFGCYGLGALFLCLVAGRRAASIASFSVADTLLTQLKIGMAAKGVWALLLVACFVKDRRAFLRRNGFELLVVLGSLLLISAVGFNGERSLWCANLFALLIVLREVVLPRGVSVGLAVALVPLYVVLLSLGMKIRTNFDTFVQLFLASPEGVTCHERVACGPFARFFHQAIYTWQRADAHGQALAEYYGRAHAPLALSRELYETLYQRDTFCRPANRLRCDGRFYTTPTANAIVLPLTPKEAQRDWNTTRVQVVYAFPGGFRSRVQRELAARRSPPVPHAERPVVLPTSHGHYLLIGKRSGCDSFITAVHLQTSSNTSQP